MTDLAIYGAGGFGRETALMIEQINRVEPCWNLTGFYDDGIAKGNTIDSLSVLGGLEDVIGVKQPLSLVVAIADPLVRCKVVSLIKSPLISYPVLVHPNVVVGSVTNYFGRGTVITAGCILTTNIVIGEFSIIGFSTTIGHDSRIGSFSSIMPACSISGHVEIGERSMVGTGARILQNLSLGQNCRVGAGAVVTKSFGDNITLVGVPAKEGELT